ncbi:MAG TPA: hypothetical protein VKA67_04840, partial [Verrucomicrobiae bacterium]|nr:hypothetical protein [Verrucomicrobiae bacterium]
QDLSDTQNRLQQLQQTKGKGERYILSPQQQSEIAKFQKKEAETKKQLKLVKRDLTREIDALKTRTEWINIAAMPLLVSISGIVLAMVKRKRTGAK